MRKTFVLDVKGDLTGLKIKSPYMGRVVTVVSVRDGIVVLSNARTETPDSIGGWEVV